MLCVLVLWAPRGRAPWLDRYHGGLRRRWLALCGDAAAGGGVGVDPIVYYIYI